ncbi:MAG: HEAT repeat domain-containing protein [Archangiaceae bacterium]|nr:HEAT repeat domain-containing protein [Archangiaceae bacterium]
MIEELHDDPGAEGRYQALAGADRDALVSALYDPSWRVRRHAAELVARAVDDATAAKLIAVLGDRDQTGARNAATTALALAGPAARAPLLELLGHSDPDQRKLAADILGERREADALEGLERALADADPNVQGAAAEALGRIGGQRASRTLMGLLSSREPLVRACALEALFALKKPPPLSLLVPLLPSKQAFRLVGLIFHPSANALVSRALEQASTRDAALAALGMEGRAWPHDAEAMLRASLKVSPDVQTWLARMLKSDDRALRVGAMNAVAALKAHALAPAVAEAVGDGSVAEAASRALTRLGLYGALALVEGEVPPVVSMSAEARAVAGEAIIRVGEPRLVPALERLLGCSDPELAEVAVRALGRCRTPAAIVPLLSALEDDALASAAARALARIGRRFRPRWGSR